MSTKKNNKAVVLENTTSGVTIEADHQIEHNHGTGVTVITTQVTIRSEAQRVVDETGAEGSFSVVVDHKDGTKESIDGPDSPALFVANPETGRQEERILPEGSTVRVERSARGAA